MNFLSDSMHASTFGVKGATLGVPKRRGLVDFVEFRNGSVLRRSGVTMAKNNTDLCGLRLGSATMETKLIGTSVGFGGSFGSSVKPRSMRVMATGLYAVADGFDLFGLLAIVKYFRIAFLCVYNVLGSCRWTMCCFA